MTFISSGSYPVKRENSPLSSFNDEVLDEFLDPQCLNGEILDFIDNTATNAKKTNNNDENNNINNINNENNNDNTINNANHNINNNNDYTTIKKENISSNDDKGLKMDIDMESPMESMTVLETPTISPTKELKLFEESKDELLKIQFGLNADSKYIHHSNVGNFPYTKAQTTTNPEDTDVTTTILPQEYQDAFFKSDDSFPYKLSLKDLCPNSRVETQIKLEISVSPPPPQFLIHIPRDAITKPKFTLADNSIPESIKQHLLYMDLFVIGSETNQLSKQNDNKVKSCNVCKRCMRRELKRASRRKAGLLDDSSNWDVTLPKRAILINSKEIVSFPPPNGNSNERHLELLSRIVCYSRHHQEANGFKILIFLKDQNNKIVGKVCSTPILIMDRKKSLKSSTPNSNDFSNKNKDTKMAYKNSITSMNDSSSDMSVATTATSTTVIATDLLSKNSKKTIPQISSNINNTNIITDTNMNTNMNINTNTNINSIPNINTNASNTSVKPKNKTGMFSSIFSFDPSNILGDESSRQTKRQKRPWSQFESTSFFESLNNETHSQPQSTSMKIINDQLNNSSSNVDTNGESKISIKKEAVSPLTSDAVSPNNNFISSATSVFSATPEQTKIYDNQISSLSGAEIFGASNTHKNNNSSSSSNNLISEIDTDLNDDINRALGIDLNLNMDVDTPEVPVIRRIIPAQGPIRGGIEITLLGSNFKPGMNVKFGSNVALATQCWSDSTIVTYLPPASQAGPVLVTFDDPDYDFTNSNAPHQIFTYTDDSDRQLIELALQIVGLKMNGKLEDAKNIAKRIVGNNQENQSNSPSQSQTQSTDNLTQIHQQLQLNWMAVASNKIKELSKTSLNHEEILIRFLNMIRIPNSLISSPNWAICNLEGQTMLHLACLKNYSKLTEFLIMNGSRVDYKDKNGFTPLSLAFIKGNRKIINILIKFKANISTKLDNGILLSDIADSNVLDLINAKRRLSDTSTDVEFDDDDDDYEEGEIDINDNIDSSEVEEFDEVQIGDYYKSSTKRKFKNHKVKHHVILERGDNDSEADNEDDSLDDSIDLQQDTVKNDRDTNSFGYNLWIAMKEAIKNKINEIDNSRDSKKKCKKQITKEKMKNGDNIVNNKSGDENGNSNDEPLPSYDDLFPDGSSLRSLINFRGHGDDSIKKQHQQHQITKNSEIMNEELDSSFKDSDVDIIADNLRTSINSDTKLLFFWLPCMLLLSLIVVGNNLNIITLDNFQFMTVILSKIREIVGSFMLGKDRFTNLINENINYGRERVEELFNDVNGAVLTAVTGVGR